MNGNEIETIAITDARGLVDLHLPQPKPRNHSAAFQLGTATRATRCPFRQTRLSPSPRIWLNYPDPLGAPKSWPPHHTKGAWGLSPTKPPIHFSKNEARAEVALRLASAPAIILAHCL